MDAEQFFSRAIAPGNFTCIAQQHSDGDRRGLYHRFFPRETGGIGAAARYARWAAGQKMDVWHAIASFTVAEPNGTDKRGQPKFKGERTQANSQFLKCFWFDADIKRDGDKKLVERSYANDTEVIDWVCSAKAMGLPYPNVWVKSGWGLHFYWILEDAIPAAQWTSYAHAFRALLTATGAVGDLGVSIDSARLLRPPQTLNFKVKDDPKPVQVVTPEAARAGDFPNDIFLKLLEPYMQASKGQAASNGADYYGSKTLDGTPPSVASVRQSSMNADATVGVSRPHHMAEIAKKCLQVEKTLNEHGANDGRTLWRGMLTLAHFCDDGAQYVHLLGDAHPSYTPLDTNKEVSLIASEVQAKGVGPTLCKSFNTERGGICQTCPHFSKINSPITLGVEDADLGDDGLGDDGLGIPLRMDADTALKPMNERFAVVRNWGGAIAFIEPEPLAHTADRLVRQYSVDEFKRILGNRYVIVPGKDGGDPETKPLAAWWLPRPDRRGVRDVVFEPHQPKEDRTLINTWRGLELSPGNQSCNLLLAHIRDIICAGDQTNYDYLMKWLGHTVQWPGVAPGSVVVLRSDDEGAGKSLLLKTMCEIIGKRHAIMVDTPDELMTQYNSRLENKCFIGCDEVNFPGDHRGANKFKGMVTAPYWTINEKYERGRQAPNIAHLMLTTNEEWAINAGSKARRWFVLEVDESRVNDHPYFDALVNEIEAGGREGFLRVLMNTPVARDSVLHPPRTAALRRQQLHSAKPWVQWAYDSAQSGVIVRAGGTPAPGGGFGMWHDGRDLYASYETYCRTSMRKGVSVDDRRVWGKRLAKCQLQTKTVDGYTHYFIPDAVGFLAAVNRGAGII